MLSVILREVANILTLDAVMEFAVDTMQSITSLSETGKRSMYTMEEYIFIAYIHLETEGMEEFVRGLEGIRGHLRPAEEMAGLIVTTVERAIDRCEFEDTVTDDPLKAARNIIWRIVNSSRMVRRYKGETEARVTAGDILDDIVDHLSLHMFAEEQEEEVTEATEEASELEPQYSELNMDCAEFQDVFKVAETFVDTLLRVAVDLTNERLISTAEETASVSTATQYYLKHRTLTKADELRLKIQSAIPQISEFTVENGLAAISAYIATWQYTENWAHCIRFLHGQSDDCSDYYTYEALWSLPTQLYPVAQATASVFFTIDVSRVKPPQCPVDISYKFEGNSFVHPICKHEFKEEWLLKILDSKIALFRKVTF